MNSLAAYGSDEDEDQRQRGAVAGPSRSARDMPPVTGGHDASRSREVTPLVQSSSKPGTPLPPTNKLGIKRSAGAASSSKASSLRHPLSPSPPVAQQSAREFAQHDDPSGKGNGKRPRRGEDAEADHTVPHRQARSSAQGPGDAAFIQGTMPPPRGSDGDPFWGLPPVPKDAPVDAELQAKLAEFHRLKAEGTHFNASLATNRSFRNPHIYAKLVSFLALDECGSNYPRMTAPGAWDPPRPPPTDGSARAADRDEREGGAQRRPGRDKWRDGNADRLAELQRAAMEEKQKLQERGARKRIDFASSAPRSRDVDGLYPQHSHKR